MPDRNFDDIADHFAKRIHDSRKGQLRHAVIQRDLSRHLPDTFHASPKRVLDLAGGLGQFAVEYALAGHEVVYNDISIKMIEKARSRAASNNVCDQITWQHSPYQDLTAARIGQFDLIFCHALIEWLADPEALIPHLQSLLKNTGQLSLCFYNPAGMTYRNLIRGNFNFLNQAQPKPDRGSLTPQNPQRYETVFSWLEAAQLEQKALSGIRVFSDYVVEKRGGLADPEAIFQMEMRYSDQPPYCYLGRYLHTIYAPA